jgi:hypothetical protein
MNAQERSEKIELYGCGYALLLEALKQVPREAINFKPAPIEWSVHEIVVHLADSEAIAAQQARMMVAEPGKAVMAYDPAAWADNLIYSEQGLDESLELLKLVRVFTYNWFKRLPESAYALSAEYPGDAEPYVLDDLLKIYAGHIPSHIEQIQKNMEVWRKQK